MMSDINTFANGNMQGQKLEKEGKTDLAIEEYEKLIKLKADTPFTYRRLATIYKKRKQSDNERRVVEAALVNVPKSNNVHYPWFVNRLKKL